jgi:hypothetical protein
MNSNENLDKTLQKIIKLKAIQMYESTPKLMWTNFLAGISHGLGVIFAATVIVALLIFGLSQLQWVPIIGDFIAKIVAYLSLMYGNNSF